MKITFVSNAMSHHQKPFCDYLASMDSVEFRFIATKPLTSERKGMGYTDLNCSEEYIIRSYENEEKYMYAKDTAENSDFVIYGSAPYDFIKNRLKNNKWTFIYSERVFKRKSDYLMKLKLFLIYTLRYGIYSGKNVRILCASAYAAQDFHKFGFKQNQMYKWGYFPQKSIIDEPYNDKNKKTNSLVWVGRLIPLKHPETVIQLAQRLKEENIDFNLTMVGNGELENAIRSQVNEYDLNDYVSFTGAVPAHEVRMLMERSEIMITTSDQNEGWGAVINEGMSSGCAVCASKEMGASPFLINDDENGCLFSYIDHDKLFNKVKQLLEDNDKRQNIAKKAFLTIENEWNSDNAARKLVELCEHLKDGESKFAFPDGICSFADINI